MDNRKWKHDGRRDYLAEWRDTHWAGKATVLFFVLAPVAAILWAALAP